MNININSPICGTGYGVAGINICKQLHNLNYNISLFNIGKIFIDNIEDDNLIQTLINNQDSFDYNAPCLKIWHQFDLASKIGRGKYIAYPFFELTLFNEKEKHHLKFPDELIASSDWAKNILLENGINSPIHVVPLGVDRNIFNHELYNHNKKDNDKYIFITVGKWEKRKSHELVIELFNKAFEPTDNVELWMVTHNPFLPKQVEDAWHNLVLTSKMKQHIKIFPRIDTQKDLAQLISYADCGVYISRAEGWNLDMLETMSMNKPVITTNYSAHTEFCNHKNSYLVEITDLEDANDGLWFHGFGQWAKIGNNQKDQIINYMRKVYTDKIIENINGVLTAKQFSWKNSADKIIRCITS